MQRIHYLSNRIGEINKDLKLLPEKRVILLKKIEVIKQEFAINSNNHLCMRLPFYAAVKNSKFEKTSRLIRPFIDGVDRYLKFIKIAAGFTYKEKRMPLPKKIRDNLLSTIAKVEEEIEKKRNGLEKIQWDLPYFFEESSKGTSEKDWGNLWEEGLRVHEAITAHHAKLSAELQTLDRQEKELNHELALFESQREAAVFSCKLEPLKKRAGQIGIDWNELVNGLKEGTPRQRIEEASKQIGAFEEIARKKEELEKTRKNTTEMLEELAKSRYIDIREKAEVLLRKIKEDDAVLGTAAEARSLTNSEHARNLIRERLAQEFEETRKKSGLVQKFFQNLGLRDSPAEELETLGKESEFYKEEYLEHFLRVQEEVYSFYGLIIDLNHLGKHKEIDLRKLKEGIANAAQERDFDTLEMMVQNLWNSLKDTTKEGQTKKESEIMKKKKELGFELKRNLVILVRVENLKHCMGKGGLEILLKKKTLEYSPKHSHVLSGIRPSLQKLGFNPDKIMKTDSITIHMDKMDIQRLQAILELEKMIKKGMPAERQNAGV